MKIKDGQRLALYRLLKRYTDTAHGMLFLVSRMTGRTVRSLGDLSVKEWQEIRNEAFPNWVEDDWTVSEDFDDRCHALHRQYLEEKLGQKALF